ncbi:MAG: divalent-cation tolerance protein CutA [Chlamydiales bacterium]
MKNDFVQIFWTSESLNEAREIGRALVKKKLVACVNIIPKIESIFFWNQQIEVTEETKVIFKTRALHFHAIKETILAQSKYQIPEILMVSITDGNQDYLDWVAQNTVAVR